MDSSGAYDNVIDLLAATRAHDRGAASRRRSRPSQRHAGRIDPAYFRIRITLDDTDVWRLVDVRSDARLDVVHDVVQVCMGWTNSHLHQFTKVGGAAVEQYLTQYAIDEGDTAGVPEVEVRLDEVLAEPGDTLSYNYDFGDDWQHTLTLEEVRPVGTDTAVCVDGAKACPPEDCGGLPGYDSAVEAVADTAAADPDLLSWLGPWDPERFDIAATNAALDRWTTMPDGLDSLADPTYQLPEAVAELVLRVRDRSVQWELVGLARGAELGEQPDVDPDVAAAMVRPYQWLMDRVGPNGIATTASGYLKPADVLACAQEFFADDAIGKLNRESLTPPVLHLRESAQRVGLIRKLHGQFVLTITGRKLTGDPVALWRHLAARVPTGDKATMDAGRIVFLLAANGRPVTQPHAVHRPLVALGWGYSATAPISESGAFSLAYPTVWLLELLGAVPGPRRGAVAANPEGGIAFARAALRG